MGEKKKKSRRAKAKQKIGQVAGMRIWDFLLFIFGIIIGRRLHIEIAKYVEANMKPADAEIGWDTLFAMNGLAGGHFAFTQADAIGIFASIVLVIVGNIFARKTRFGRILRYLTGGILGYFVLFELYELVFGTIIGQEG